MHNGEHRAAICQNVKRCQVVKKMSNVKKSNTWTMEEVYKNKKDIMRFTHIGTNFDITYDGDHKLSKCA